MRLSASDVEFLLNSANKLPGRSESNSPVTVDLNAAVAIRAKTDGQPVSTELVLANTTATGKPLRVNVNRCFLTRALKLGFRDIHLYGPETTVLCRDEQRSYECTGWLTAIADLAAVSGAGCLRYDVRFASRRPGHLLNAGSLVRSDDILSLIYLTEI